MAVPEWPDDLPQFAMVEGFSLTLADGRTTFKTETGPGMSRLANSAAVEPVRVQLPPLSPDEQARLRRFWLEDLGRGVKPFLIRDLVFDGIALADEDGNVLTDEDNQPLASTDWWLVMFGPSPGLSAKPGMFFVPQFELLRLA